MAGLSVGLLGVPLTSENVGAGAGGLVRRLRRKRAGDRTEVAETTAIIPIKKSAAMA